MAYAGIEQIKKDFLEYEKTEDKVKYLKQVSEKVSKHRNARIPLRKPESSEWKIGGQDVTSYSEDDGTVEEWGIFYLPDSVKMEILGAVENHTECDQLVIMLCEDLHVYAYDGEEMHLVALSLKDLFDSGLQYPGSTSYYRGECFENMTKADWDKVKQGRVGKELEKKHQELLDEATPILLKCLDIIQRDQCKDAGHYPEPLEPQTVPVKNQ